MKLKEKNNKKEQSLSGSSSIQQLNKRNKSPFPKQRKMARLNIQPVQRREHFQKKK